MYSYVDSFSLATVSYFFAPFSYITFYINHLPSLHQRLKDLTLPPMIMYLAPGQQTKAVWILEKRQCRMLLFQTNYG